MTLSLSLSLSLLLLVSLFVSAVTYYIGVKKAKAWLSSVCSYPIFNFIHHINGSNYKSKSTKSYKLQTLLFV